MAKGRRRDKQARVSAPVAPAKKPQFSEPVFRGDHISWRFSRGDRDGPWAWTQISAKKLAEVIRVLAAIETMHPTDIQNRGHHEVPIESLCKEATDRLMKLRYDDQDKLWSFRINGSNRVWCIGVGSMMRVLWWDPSHQVCPSLKKHT